jgi:RND family efflux transporter MFP subunit
MDFYSEKKLRAERQRSASPTKEIYTAMRIEENPQTEVTQIKMEARPASPPSRTSTSKVVIGVLVFVLAVAAIVVAGIVPRLRARAALRGETTYLATPTVTVVQPKLGAPSQEIVLPSNMQAFTDSPIYARTNGYLRHWYTNIGARVKAGELMADIETPEVDEQLRQAHADVDTAQANLQLSQVTAKRYTGLLAQNSVSQQETDNATSDLAAKSSMVESSQANLKRLEDLQSFEKVYAPFNGVVTARNVDIGDLIDAGSSGGAARELFHVADTHILRVFVNVPQAYSPNAKPGLKADVTLAEFPGRHFEGTLVRTANAIDLATRTLLVEVDVPNPTGELLPGAYAEVHFKIPGVTRTYILPVGALLFRSEGLRVATVQPDGKALLKQITLGRDFGNTVEVTGGLDGNESIMENPPDAIVNGEAVRVTK